MLFGLFFKPLGTDRLLRPRGGGGGGGSEFVVYENCTPLKEFHMKIVPPLATRIFKMHPPPSTPTFPRPRVLTIWQKISEIPDGRWMVRSLFGNSNRKLRSTFWGSPFIPVRTNQTECCLPLTNFSVPSRFQTHATQIRPFFGFKP